MTFEKFTKEMISIGILSHKEHETLYDIAKRCARDVGMPLAGGALILGAKSGVMTVPGVGPIAVGKVALAGLITGTLTCTALNVALRQEIRKLAQ